MDISVQALTALAQARQASKGVSDAQLIKRRDVTRRIPVTSHRRLLESVDDQPFNISEFLGKERVKDTDSVLYLGYGSNLSAEAFQGRREIKPISQVNVVVPALSLTFDLPGIPYSEPCFGNVRYREIPSNEEKTKDITTDEYNKDHWRKGLVGVVYEVTKSDYAHIIATEGGGSGYQDVLVECYSLSQNPMDKVPENPTGAPFKSHTLFAPAGIARPSHSYAQPSPRYLKLITDGANEHALPYEYQEFLNQIRTYHVTTTQQRLGQFIFLSLWSPLFTIIFGAGQIFLNPDGTYPPWFAALARAIFTGCWSSYDSFFKPNFGDGERTIGDSDGSDTSRRSLDQYSQLSHIEKADYGTLSSH